MIALVQLIARNRLALLGMIVLAALVLVSLITPLLPLADPDVIDTARRFKRPFTEGALLGTDHLGRDLLSRLLWGTRLSLLVGFSAAMIAAVIGAGMGIVAGYFGGLTDNLIMRGVDTLMGFPYILLALAIVAVLGPGLFNALIAVAAVNIPFFARNIRGVTVTIVHLEYVDAARLNGRSHLSIIVGEVLPNVIPTIVVAASTTVGWMILETAGLSFLGLGSQPPQADLGSMLGEARAALITSPHTSFVPGAMILIIVMGVNLLGDGIRDALDPRLKAGALSRPQPATKVARAAASPAQAEPAQAEPGPAPQHALAVSNLSTSFDLGARELKAVRHVNLHLTPGECLGIIGESGSGKSVTALSILRLVASPPGVIKGGSVTFDGRDLVRLPQPELRRIRGNRIAYIFQDPLTTLHPLLTVGTQLLEAIKAHQRITTQEARERALELLTQVRIADPRRVFSSHPHQLSGGMRQRIGIALALCNDPDVIIADEPTTALDVTVQAQILALLDDLRRERGLSVIFITHDFSVVSQLCDRVAVLYAGEVVELGTTQQVIETPLHPYTAKLMQCVPQLGAGKRRLNAIPGLPPRADEQLVGCAFASRCHRVSQACRQHPIALGQPEPERAVRCLHPGDEATAPTAPTGPGTGPGPAAGVPSTEAAA
jgi:peptide/nickel transport system permease protein